MESAEIFQLLVLVSHISRHAMEIDDCKVVVLCGLFRDIQVVYVQIRQTDIDGMSSANERTEVCNNFFLVPSLKSVPSFSYKSAEAGGLQLFGDNERFCLDTKCPLLAVADWVVSPDVVVEKQPGAFKFIFALRAGFADISPRKYDVLEVRTKETLDEEGFLLLACSQAETDNTASTVAAFCARRHTLEEIIERRNVESGEKTRPGICKNYSLHLCIFLLVLFIVLTW